MLIADDWTDVFKQMFCHSYRDYMRQGSTNSNCWFYTSVDGAIDLRSLKYLYTWKLSQWDLTAVIPLWQTSSINIVVVDCSDIGLCMNSGGWWDTSSWANQLCCQTFHEVISGQPTSEFIVLLRASKAELEDEFLLHLTATYKHWSALNINSPVRCH